MAISPFTAAINQLADERGLPRDVIHDTINTAVAAAYRKEYGHSDQVMRAEFDEETGKFLVWQIWDVVEEVENEQNQKLEADAKKIKKSAKVGETVEIELEPHSDFGRIAAQTAKQVITQKLREAEREILLSEYQEKIGQLINGYVQQVEGPNVILNIGKLNGLMIASDQITGQYYYPGQRARVLVYSVEDTPKGPRVMVTRSAPEFIAKLFELEVPEIAQGNVIIKNIVREAGFRTKMAVTANQQGLDPVGSCVGQRGTRVNAVLSEIGNERIDIIPYNEDIVAYISSALAPAKIDSINLKKKTNTAEVLVPDDQLSLAIGKNGQNVRLASKLTGWEIDIIKKDIKGKIEKVKTDAELADEKVATDLANTKLETPVVEETTVEEKPAVEEKPKAKKAPAKKTATKKPKASK